MAENEGYSTAYTGAQVNAALAMALLAGDVITESGAASGWHYLKLNSGVSIAWSYFYTDAMTMTEASGIWLSEVKQVAFPSGLFIAMPVPILQVVASGALIGAKATGATSKNYLTYQVSRSWNNGDGTYVAALCIGNWK